MKSMLLCYYYTTSFNTNTNTPRHNHIHKDATLQMWLNNSHLNTNFRN